MRVRFETTDPFQQWADGREGERLAKLDVSAYGPDAKAMTVVRFDDGSTVFAYEDELTDLPTP